MGHYVYTNLQTYKIIALATKGDDVESLSLLLETKYLRRYKNQQELGQGRIIRYSEESPAAIRHKARTIPNAFSEISTTCWIADEHFNFALKHFVEYYCPYINLVHQKRGLLNIAVRACAYKAVQFWLNDGALIDDSTSDAYYPLSPDSLTLMKNEDERMRQLLTKRPHPQALQPAQPKPPANDFLALRKELILLAIHTYEYEALCHLFKLTNIDDILSAFGTDIAEREQLPHEQVKELGLAYLLAEAVKHYAEAIVSFLLRTTSANPNLAFTSVSTENTALKLAESLKYNELLLRIIKETKPFNNNELPAPKPASVQPAFMQHRFSAFSPFKPKNPEPILEEKNQTEQSSP